MFIVIFSIFVANVANLINTDRNAATNKLNVRNADSSEEAMVDKEGKTRIADGLEGVRIGTSKQHLMWFMQVTISVCVEDKPSIVNYIYLSLYILYRFPISTSAFFRTTRVFRNFVNSQRKRFK